MKANLCLHTGAAKVSREAVLAVNAPAPTDTWHPIPHRNLLEAVESSVRNIGYGITGEAHALSHNGDRYFGLLEVNRPGENREDYSYVLGVRGSIDKSFSSAVCVGSQVFVCDNLSFSGEVQFARKYTVNIERDLPILTARIIGALSERWADMNARLDTYKQTPLSDREAHDLVIRALDAGACTTTQIPHLLNQWRNPNHAEFKDRNAFSLFNAFTEIYKPAPDQGRRAFAIARLVPRTTALHGLLDAHCGILTPTQRISEGVVDAEVVVNN